MTEGIRQKMAAEKEKMSSMNRQEKIAYIIDYYKVHILIGIALIALIIGVIWQVFFNNREVVYHFAIINEEMNTESDRQMMDSLTEYFDLNPRREEVTVDSMYNIPYMQNEEGVTVNLDGSPSSDHSTYEKFFLNMSVNAIDAAVMPESFMTYCNGLGRYYSDLRDIFSEDFLSRYEDRFCYSTDDTGEEYLCGLYTDGTVFDASYFARNAGEEMIEAYGKQVLAFPLGSKHTDRHEAFVQWVFEVMTMLEE